MPKTKSSHRPGTPKKHQIAMDKVTIKRVKRNKKKITTGEKILGAVGFASSLLGGASPVSAKPTNTEIVRTNTEEKGSSSSQIRETLNRLFGVSTASAATPDIANMDKTQLLNYMQSLNVPNPTPDQQASLSQAQQLYYGTNYGQNLGQVQSSGTSFDGTSFNNGNGGVGANFIQPKAEVTTGSSDLAAMSKTELLSYMQSLNVPNPTAAQQKALAAAQQLYYSTNYGSALASPASTTPTSATTSPVQLNMTNVTEKDSYTGTNQSLNSNQFATLEAAKAYAQMFGGTVEAVVYTAGTYQMSQPMYVVRVGNAVLNAGLIGQTLKNYGNGILMIQQQIAQENASAHGGTPTNLTVSLTDLTKYFPSITQAQINNTKAANVSSSLYQNVYGSNTPATPTVTASPVSASPVSVTVKQTTGGYQVSFVDPQTGTQVTKDFADKNAFGQYLQSYNIGGDAQKQSVFMSLSNVYQNWNSVATGTVLPDPSATVFTSDVWADQFNNRAAYVGDLGGIVYYDSARNLLILDKTDVNGHPTGNYTVLTNNSSYNQSSVAKYTNLLTQASITNKTVGAGYTTGAGSDANYSLLSQIGRAGAGNLGTNSGSSGTLAQGTWYALTDSGMAASYAGNANSFKTTWEKDAQGNPTTITIETTDSKGRSVVRTFYSPQDLMSFLDKTSGAWAGQNTAEAVSIFNALPSDVKALYTAANAARSNISNFPYIATQNRIITAPTAAVIHNPNENTQAGGAAAVGVNPDLMLSKNQAQAALTAFQKAHPDAQLVDYATPQWQNSGNPFYLDYNGDTRREWTIQYTGANGQKMTVTVDNYNVNQIINPNGSQALVQSTPAPAYPSSGSSAVYRDQNGNFVYNSGAGTATGGTITGGTANAGTAFGGVIQTNPVNAGTAAPSGATYSNEQNVVTLVTGPTGTNIDGNAAGGVTQTPGPLATSAVPISELETSRDSQTYSGNAANIISPAQVNQVVAGPVFNQLSTTYNIVKTGDYIEMRGTNMQSMNSVSLQINGVNYPVSIVTSPTTIGFRIPDISGVTKADVTILATNAGQTGMVTNTVLQFVSNGSPTAAFNTTTGTVQVSQSAVKKELPAVRENTAVSDSAVSSNTTASLTTGAGAQTMSVVVDSLEKSMDTLSSQLSSKSTPDELQSVNEQIAAIRLQIESIRNHIQSPGSAVATQSLASDQSAAGTYTVKKGDTLWGVAKKFYGDGKLWRKVFQANIGTLKNPENIQAGMVLTIPTLTSSNN